ncbi:MAG: peptidase C39 family protein [Candidatus Micrarchaeaceae archaeon]
MNRKNSKLKKAAMPERGKSALKKSKMLEIPNYPQSEEFTSAAACALMALKYINKNMQTKKSMEYDIWEEANYGSVWHGSRYGIAYALAKRGAKSHIITNVKDEGYEKKLAVYEGINLETLRSSFNEIKKRAESFKIKEIHKIVTLNTIKKELNSNRIPIVLVDSNKLSSQDHPEPSPHWVVVKGYDKDTVYINDPYSNETISMEPQVFRGVLGYDNECHLISVSTKR